MIVSAGVGAAVAASAWTRTIGRPERERPRAVDSPLVRRVDFARKQSDACRVSDSSSQRPTPSAQIPCPDLVTPLRVPTAAPARPAACRRPRQLVRAGWSPSQSSQLIPWSFDAVPRTSTPSPPHLLIHPVRVPRWAQQTFSVCEHANDASNPARLTRSRPTRLARPSCQSCAQTPQPHACLSRQLVLSPPSRSRPSHPSA